jgi:hypothetical protein
MRLAFEKQRVLAAEGASPLRTRSIQHGLPPSVSGWWSVIDQRSREQR